MKHEYIQIRRATSEDTNAIVELWKEYMDFHAERDHHFTRSEEGPHRFGEYISGRIVDDASCVLVAEHEQDVMGYCLATLAKFPSVFAYREYGSISDLAVTARFRHQGIGQALVEAAFRWFAERDVHRIEVRAATSNEVSTAFWRKMGFAPYIEILYREQSRG
jgi:ribosomal protein S18 acetylase RimI-like enzyme